MVKLSEIRFYPIDSADTEERAFRSSFLHHTQTVPPHRIEYHRKKNRGIRFIGLGLPQPDHHLPVKRSGFPSDSQRPYLRHSDP